MADEMVEEPELDSENDDEIDDSKQLEMMKKMKKKKKRKSLALMESSEKRGVCHLSRIPPHMDPTKLCQILSHYGDIIRIYLIPENPEAQIRRKKSGGFRGQQFSEGWVEFEDKRVAKRVAEMLNNQQIGGKKRSPFYYDIWNIKYLKKYKWDDLTGETANQRALKEQKLEVELRKATREKNFYLDKVEKARGLNAIDERLKKKQKIQQETGTDIEKPVTLREKQVFRQFRQTMPVTDKAGRGNTRISRDILAGVFGSSS